MGKLKTVLIMAGGTGGHVFPGLAVANKMREQGIDVHWLGTQKGLEARLVPEAGFPMHYISISGIRGKGMKDLLLAPFRLIHAVFQAKGVIRQLKPDVVLGMGGFVSGPGGIAAWLMGCPVIVHEQNAKAGMTNAWLARVAKKVLEGFPSTFPGLKKAVSVGNPVRMEIAVLPPPEERFENRKNTLQLLVLGGSLGAQAINELLPLALAQMPVADRPAVLHQTGEKHLDNTKEFYQKAGVTAEIVPFIQEMDKAYTQSDLVLCRAGALTVAELCAAGLGAILVPFPHAVDDHQTANGSFMAKQGAAILIQQKDLTVEKLAALLSDFNAHREKCVTMAQAARSLRRIDATNKVLDICEEVLR